MFCLRNTFRLRRFVGDSVNGEFGEFLTGTVVLNLIVVDFSGVITLSSFCQFF